MVTPNEMHHIKMMRSISGGEWDRLFPPLDRRVIYQCTGEEEFLPASIKMEAALKNLQEDGGSRWGRHPKYDDVLELCLVSNRNQLWISTCEGSFGLTIILNAENLEEYFVLTLTFDPYEKT